MIKNITAILALLIVAVGGALIIQKGSENLSQIPSSTQLAQVAPTSGLIGYWNFDNGTASDSSGSGNNGTVSGATAATGKIGGGLSFNGSTDKVTLGSDVVGTGADTICAWIYPRSLGASNYSPNIVSNGTLGLYFFQGASQYTIGFTSGSKYPSAGSFGLNSWQHICVARTSAGVATFYLNGVQVGSADSGAPVAGYNAIVLGNRSQGDQGFDGIMDEVRIYNTALTATDVAAVYNYKGVVAPSTYTVTVTKSGSGIVSSPKGIDCAGGLVCTETLSAGSQDTITATPSTGYTFAGWGGACNGTSTTCTVTVNSNTSITANFSKIGVTLPVISGASTSGITATAATVSWSANVPVTSKVFYGVSTGYGSNTASSTSNTANLSGLQANTLYHYKIVSADASGNIGTSGDNTFTTSQVVVDYNTTLTANPTTITAGQSTTLTWSAPNATGCTASGGWSGTKATSGTQTVTPTANTTYTITCTGIFGPTASATVTVLPVTTGKFSIGQKVQVNTTIAVRSTPSSATGSNKIGTQAVGTTGTVATGSGYSNPTVADGLTWWYINYDAAPATPALSGWSTESYLAACTTSCATQTTFTVTKTITGTGSGTVTCNPASCSNTVGSSVSLFATPASNSSFLGWGGACSGTGTCTLTSAGSVTATFNIINGTDTIAPTTPTNLAATVLSGTQINLTWTASTDNVGVKGYYVYRDGLNIANINPAQTTFSNTTLTPGTTYAYTVAAYDAAGNISAQSTSVTKTTTTATTYTITATAGANGTISPSGATTVTSGGSQSFTITPNTGYVIGTVILDGVSTTPGSPYNFTNVTANHTIAVTFSSNVAPVTVSLTASPSYITTGQSSILSWSSSGATSCTGTGFSTNGATSGSVSTGNLSSSASYGVTCAGTTGTSQSASATVTVGTVSSGGISFPPIADRVVDFTNAGVQGGIPNRQTSCGTVSASNGSDITSQLQTLINNCPANQVVNIPAGTFKISSTINIGPTGNKSNITVRGAGPSTILQTSVYKSFIIGSQEWPAATSRIANGVASTFTKGATQIQISSTPAGLAVGQLVLIDELNSETAPDGSALVDGHGSGSGRQSDGSISVGTYCRDNQLNCTRSEHQTVMITAINGNTITISDPLYHDYKASPQVTVLINTIQGIGLENFKLQASTNGAYFGFEFDNTYNSWMKGIETDSIVSYPVYIYNSAHFTLRDSYFHDLFAGQRYTIDRAYGVDTLRVSSSLFENNLFARMRVAIFIDHGSAGNVVAYNYVTEQKNDDAPDNLVESFTTNHGAHTIYNLFEGNVAPKFQSDYYYGSASHTTLFRNNFTGAGANMAVGIDRFNLYYSVIGNVLGAPSDSGKYYQFDESHVPSNQVPWNATAYFRLGYPMIGNFSFEGINASGASTADADRLKYDTRTKATLIRGGNYDYVNRKAIWSDTGAPSDGSTYLSSTQSIPSSLFKVSTPAEFTNSSSVWPPIDGATGRVSDLPAKKCYSVGFNAAACYGVTN